MKDDVYQDDNYLEALGKHVSQFRGSCKNGDFISSLNTLFEALTGNIFDHSSYNVRKSFQMPTAL